MPTTDDQVNDEQEEVVTEEEQQEETEEEAPGEEQPEEKADTFDRTYVEKLRKEAADARVKAKGADALAEALWSARVSHTGRLADPTDLPMPEGADPMDEEAITTAIDALLERKPHLESRMPRGKIGQGEGLGTGSGGDVDLAGIMRAHA